MTSDKKASDPRYYSKPDPAAEQLRMGSRGGAVEAQFQKDREGTSFYKI
jgi:hypothetical protein